MSAAGYASVLSPSKIPQSEPVPGKTMVANSAGGFTFAVDCWQRLNRFLILGSEGGSYYASERKLTVENAASVLECVKQNGPETVRRIVAVSDAGRAPKNSPAIFALALAAENGNEETKREAYAALPAVCRIVTHLFEFVAAKKLLGGAFGSGCRRAISRWYTDKTPDDLAYQLVKYRNRIGYTHRDVLRLSRPSKAGEKGAILRWATHGKDGMGELTKGSTKPGSPAIRSYAAESYESLPDMIRAFDSLQMMCQAKSPTKDIAKYVADNKLPWETIPTEYLWSKEIWEALLPNLPMAATVRNLGRMTANGLISPLSDASKTICERVRDADYVKKSRLHPMSVLLAMKTYSQGRGDKGSLTWTPVPSVIDALNDAFYLAFGNVEPTGKRWLLALDVSGSMSNSISGSSLSCREASAAMALVTMAVEPECYLFGFSTRFVPLGITPKMRLDEAVKAIAWLPFEGTNCALPMIWAKENNVKADCFSVYTDNETWAGKIHPFVALKEYRQATGINAKSAVVGMATNEFTIADPSDPGMCDFVGFDSSTPVAMAEFAKM